MNPEQRIIKLEKEVGELKSYLTGLTGNLNFKNTVGRFAKEAVVQQIASVDEDNPDTEIINTISLSGGAEDIDVLDFPDFFVFLRDKDNNVYKVPAYTVTL